LPTTKIAMAGGNRSSTIDEAESGGGSVAMESKEIPQPQPVEVLSANAPPPFLSKTYDMVDDPATDPIVSWSSNNNSFVFLSSFLVWTIRNKQLNLFVWTMDISQKHLLKTITRRKPAHVHGHGQQHSNGQNPSVSSCVEVGKFGLEEEVERLKRDKKVLMQELVRLRQQQQSTDNNLQRMRDGIVSSKDSASPDGQIVKYQPPMHEQAKAMLKKLMKMEPYKTGDDGFHLGDGTSTTTEMEISSNNVSGITLQEMPTASDIQSSSLTGATPENVTVAESPTPEEAIPSPDVLSLPEFASILPKKTTEMPSGNFMEPNMEDFSYFLDSDLFIDGDFPFDIDDIPSDPDLEPSVDKYASLLEDILMSSPLPDDMDVTPVDLRHRQ
ncbi:hypothetical protein HID58_029054, partial [Brassica napus]